MIPTTFIRISVLFPPLLLPPPCLARDGQPAKGNDIDWAGLQAECPECGWACGLEITPKYCQDPIDTNCLCYSEDLLTDIARCISKKCTLAEAYRLERLNQDVCQYPERNRRADLLPVVGLEVLALSSIVARCAARLKTVGKLELDDWIMTGILCIYLAMCVVGNMAVAKAFGVDITHLDAATVTLGFKLFFFSQSLYLICLTLTKICILMFFLRVFPHNVFRTAALVMVTTIGLCGTMLLALQIFQCSPVSYNWRGWTGDFEGAHKCLSKQKLAYAAAGVMMAHDFIVIVLPFPILLRLNTHWKNKAGILLMFSLGVFDLVTSGVRLHYLVKFEDTINPSWDYTDILLWSGIEVAVAIIVANLPAIRILLCRLFVPRVERVGKMVARQFILRPPPGEMGTGARTGTMPEIVVSGAGSGTGTGNVPWYEAGLHGGNTNDRDRDRNRDRNRNYSIDDERQYGFRLGGGTGGSGAGGKLPVVTEAAETELELGDKLKGDVETKIEAGGIAVDEIEMSLASPWRKNSRCSRKSTDSGAGIFVETTTVVVIEDSSSARHGDGSDRAGDGSASPTTRSPTSGFSPRSTSGYGSFSPGRGTRESNV
ncbi:hypothetical protein MKZ38_004475 [Zalerion maritima]|uniref:CFEM domain-containing protein n=1 Tax=Zalerion maritima TaxID=339359 RepID=A0AAD5RML7_9PEZI|nr:hypothetical protein MKZ38_004475 [Zalerion maritima]